MNKQSRLLAVLLFALLLVSGWVVWRETHRDRSLVTDIPCSAPCWQGIIPGVTTRQEALEILQTNTYIQSGSGKSKGNDELGGYTWKWRVPGLGKWLPPSIEWQNNVVQEIKLGLTFDFTVQAAIQKFGLPEAISISRGGTPEHWYWIVRFFYPQKGMDLSAYTSEYENEIYPSTEIGVVTLYAPTNLELRLKILYDEVLYKTYSWRGYGNLIELYHPDIVE